MKKTLSLILALVLGLGLIPAFASAEGEKLFTEPFEIKILAATYAPYDINMTDIWDEIYRVTNVKLDFEWAPSADFATKVGTVLASGVDNLPDLIGGATLSSMLDQGAVIALDPYLEYAPNLLAALNERDMLKWREFFDGQAYAIPTVMDVPGSMSTMVRTDWLERVGKEIPTTWEEFVDVLIAFRDNDANGDGDPKNEIPYALDTNGFGMTAILNCFGINATSNTQFCVLPDGTYSMVYEHPNYQAFAEAVQMLYSEGLLDPEFATRQQATLFQIMDNNTCGFTLTYAERARISMEVNMELDPDASWQCIPPIIGPYGDQMIFAREKVSKPYVITIAAEMRGKVQGIMEFVNWMYSEEGSRMSNFGIEGKHHEMVDGKPVLLPPYNTDFATARISGLIHQPFFLLWSTDVYAELLTSGKPYDELSIPQQRFYDGLFVINNDYFVDRPSVYLTEAWIAYQAELVSAINVARDKMFSGQTTFDAFLAEYEVLKGRGLSEIIEQGNEAYQKVKGM